MMGFFSVSLSRDEFLGWMGSGGRLTLTGSKARYSRRREYAAGDVIVFWKDDSENDNGHPLVAVPFDSMNEFFAFTGTYISTYRPYSAFYRVVPLEWVDEIANRRSINSHSLTALSRIIAGAALAEHYLRARSSRRSSAKSPLAPMRNTLSAALGSAIVSGYSVDTLFWVADEWAAVQGAFSPASVQKIDSLDTISIFSIVHAVVNKDRIDKYSLNEEKNLGVYKLISAALHAGDINVNILSSFNQDLPPDINLADVLRASRERRIKVFNDFVSDTIDGSRNFANQAFVAGLLLAIAGNGSFEMLRSARILADRMPLAIIWFGICAALFADSNVLTTGHSLGRRFVRDIIPGGHVADPPEADLNSFEFRNLFRDVSALDQINSMSDELISVEILPDVFTYVVKPTQELDNYFSDEFKILSESFQEMRKIVERVQRRVGTKDEYRQREMFKPNMKPPSRDR